MKYVSIDIETCGLDPETCDILEFGAVLDDLTDRRPINILPKFHCYFVLPEYRGQPFALSMHPKIFRRIADREDGYTYVSPTRFGNMFKKFLSENGYEIKNDRVTINAAGKNFGAFDLQFLNKQTDLAKHVKIRHKILDPAMLYLKYGDNSLPGLSECKRRANMQEEVAHDAVADAIDVVKLLREELQHTFG